MSCPEQRRAVSRRSILKTAALSGGAAMMPGILRASGSPKRVGAGAERIGLLLPRDDRFASINDRLERELARQLDSWKGDAGERGEVLRVTSGGTPASVRTALESLFHDQGADRVLCYQSSLVASTLGEIANTLRRPVYLLNEGAHPLDPSALNDWLHVNTLDLFGRNRDLAEAAAESGLRRGIVLTSIAEAGFGTAEAIRAGFEGGRGVLERYLVADSPGFPSIDRERLQSVISEVRPDVIFLLLHPEVDRESASGLSSLLNGVPGLSVVRNVTASTPDVIRLAAETVERMLDREVRAEGASGGATGHSFSTGSTRISSGVPVPYL